MTDKKGFELAISTIVILVLSLLILIALLLAFMGGFKTFQSTTTPLLQSAEGSAVKKACELSCEGGDKITFCCKNFTISDKNYLCTSSQLEVNCPLNCQGFAC